MLTTSDPSFSHVRGGSGHETTLALSIVLHVGIHMQNMCLMLSTWKVQSDKTRSGVKTPISPMGQLAKQISWVLTHKSQKIKKTVKIYWDSGNKVLDTHFPIQYMTTLMAC